MPNKNMFIDEKTKTKALKAIFGDNELDFGQVLGVVERLEEAGVFFAEEIEPRKLGPRTKAEQDAAGVTQTDLNAQRQEELAQNAPPIPQ